MPEVKKNNNKEPKVNQGNLYDKIFKENAESIFIPLIEERLKIKIKKFKPLKEKMQTTLEREMDFFYEVEPEKGKPFLLHLEFQSDNDMEMVYRSGEYHGIALRKKRIEIKHIVIYLGEAKPTMLTQLKKEEIYKGFELINVHELNTKELLSSQVPEYVLMAVLSNYEKKNAEEVLQKIVDRLRKICKNPPLLSKYLKQLVNLSRLRKLEG